MKILCPSCQVTISVPESEAGKEHTCPQCRNTLTVPTLPRSATPAPKPVTTSDGYVMAPLPVVTSAPVEAKPSPVVIAPPPPISAPATAKKLDPNAIPNVVSAERGMKFSMERRSLCMIAMAIFFLVFLLSFFPWVAIAPGGHSCYAQNAWQMVRGDFSVDPVGEEVVGLSEKLRKASSWSPLILLLLFALLATVAAALASASTDGAPSFLPALLHDLWPKRQLIALALALLAFCCLLVQCLLGFGLETAAQNMAQEEVSTQGEVVKTSEKLKIAEINQGLVKERIGVRRTYSLAFAVLFMFAGTALLGLAMFLTRRGAEKRVEIQVRW